MYTFFPSLLLSFRFLPPQQTVPAVQTLLELGAPANAVNQLGQSTPMHMAVAGRQPSTIAKVLDLLLQYGGNGNVADAQGRLPIDLCPPDVSWKDKLAPAPPLWYTSLQQVDLLAFRTSCDDLATLEAPVETWQFRGQSVIEWIFETFLKRECYEEKICWPFLKYWVGREPLAQIPNDEDSLFCQYIQQRRPQHKELVNLLVPYLPSDLWQWLHRSARKNDLPTVQYCLQVLHVNPNLRGRQGMTALQFAARSGHMEILNYLLQCPDIDLQITDDRGQTPLDAARSNQRQDVIAALERKIGSLPSGKEFLHGSDHKG